MEETAASTAFDTHEAVKALKAAGADEPLAEAVVNTVGNAMGNVATKADLAELRADIYRALRLQGAGIIGVMVALLKILP